MEVSVRELKNHLSSVLRRVQAGEEVTVTSRGAAVARLVQTTQATEPDAGAVARLRAAPRVRSGAGGKVRGSRDPIRPAPGERTVADLVEEERG